jgi:hypothetical protein
MLGAATEDVVSVSLSMVDNPATDGGCMRQSNAAAGQEPEG